MNIEEYKKTFKSTEKMMTEEEIEKLKSTIEKEIIKKRNNNIKNKISENKKELQINNIEKNIQCEYKKNDNINICVKSNHEVLVTNVEITFLIKIFTEKKKSQFYCSKILERE